MNCPNCGAPMEFHHQRVIYECKYCGRLHLPEPDDQGLRIYEESGRHQCPMCKMPLLWAELDGFPAEVCPNCRGVLMLQHLFGKAVRVLRAAARKPPVEPPPLERNDLERRVACPSCGKTMSTHIYAGPGNIVIDTCLDCNLIWLDHRELRRVLDTPGRDRAL